MELCESCKENENDKCRPHNIYCTKILNLHCKRCNRYYCSNHWNEANDEYGKWTDIENGIYQILKETGCDMCNWGCDNNEVCQIKK